MTDWKPVEGGWMAAPDPDEDTADVMFETLDGEPVGVARCDLDYFGNVDEALLPPEIADLMDVVPLRGWHKPPGLKGRQERLQGRAAVL